MADFIEKVLGTCTTEDLVNGYVYDKSHGIYTCVFCGEIFDEDIIYNREDKLCTARKAVKIHIKEVHKNPFLYLLEMDRKYTSLTDRQKEIFKYFYDEKDTKSISEKMETTPSTVRSYKSKMQEKLLQAKVYMAIMQLIENKNIENADSQEETIGDIAIHEKLKAIEKTKNGIDNDDILEDLVNANYKGANLNLINLLIDKKNPNIE